nr:hypothetical protein [uncultured Chryseobacterium sp.]
MKFFYIIYFFLVSGFFTAQEKCEIIESTSLNIKKVDKEDLICIAKNSDQPITVFYTFASWCAPCRMHLLQALYLEKFFKTNVYIVLVEGESDRKIINGINYIEKYAPDAKMLVLKDAVYEGGVKKRNRQFVTDITPPQFENIADFSKFILINKEGQTVLVTNYKDNENDPDWKDAMPMIKRKIIPLLEKR